jgi:hypothetical protein
MHVRHLVVATWRRRAGFRLYHESAGGVSYIQGEMVASADPICFNRLALS